MKPGYTLTQPWDYPLDRQGHAATKLHSGTAAYFLYLGVVSTGIVYPPEEDAPKHYGFFDAIGKLPHPDYHGIWGCLHYLPLVSNMFMACYNLGTFLFHLTDGGYGFNHISSPGLDMSQMYVVAPKSEGACLMLESD